MNVLVVGGGAREDALAWRLSRSPSCERVVVAPGTAGTALRHENWPIAATNGKALVARALESKIDLVVIGPETAIAGGVADRMREAGIATFGPGRNAGRLESSKIFAKRFMERHGIPTARARVIHSLAAGERALDDWQGGCVVKADGLAAGKGVIVAGDAAEARGVLRSWFGAEGAPGGGDSILLEERLDGREVSVFAIGDGKKFVPFTAACDYKRAGDGDSGPNTGGMGAYSPPLGFPGEMYAIVQERILDPVASGLAAENESYVGVLYCGLMWTSRGPVVIEFNARFGDPETQAIVPRVRGDFAEYLASAARGRLDEASASLSAESCVCVVLATAGYPRTSTPVTNLPADLGLSGETLAFWSASTLREDGRIDSPGGRVVTISALGETLSAARSSVYGAVLELKDALGVGSRLTCRTDIGIAP
jgi:phosphoribosylamine--glycine ligase